MIGSLDVWGWTLAAVLLVSMVSLVGLAAGARFLTRHLVILFLVAMAAGSLLGDALLHLLPESAGLWGDFSVEVSFLVIFGFLAFFILESALRWRHAHAEALEGGELQAGGHGQGAPVPTVGGGVHAAATAGTQASAHEHDHAHSHGHGHPPATRRTAPYAWLNLAGDAVHNFLDGIVVAASFLVSIPVGIATTVAVALHEIPQELGDYAILVRAGIPPKRALLYNFGTALTAVLGAALVLLLPIDTATIERYALPLTAGGFLYIAAADLVPELHHHSGDRHAVLIVAGIAVGVAAMSGLLLLE
jgi:zinc and cadmium transporter